MVMPVKNVTCKDIHAALRICEDITFCDMAGMTELSIMRTRTKIERKLVWRRLDFT